VRAKYEQGKGGPCSARYQPLCAALYNDVNMRDGSNLQSRAAVWSRLCLVARDWTSNSILPSVMGLLFLALECCRYLYFFRLADDSKLTQWMPDDAFYYLVLARNFTLLHKWTFDGVAPATGFHLLWAYLIALIYWVLPGISLHQIFTLLYFFGALLMAVGLSLLCVVVRHLFGPFSVLAPIAIFCTSLALQLPNFLMESTLVVFFSCVAVYTVFAPDKRLSRRTLAAAFGVGVLGMLSRSDFGMLPLVLFVAALAIDRSIQAPRVKRAGCILAGSIFGLVLVVGHTYLASGRLLQSSVSVKRYWSTLNGDYLGHAHTWFSARNAVAPLFEAFGGNDYTAWHPFAHLSIAHLVGAVLLFVVIVGAAMSTLSSRSAITAFCAMGGVVIGYITLYTYDGAIQSWYFANYIAPFSVLAASIFAIPIRAWRALSILALAVWLYKVSPLRRSSTPIWPQQAGYYEAGLYLREHPELKPVAAWNAGIASYIAGGGIINVDGLVNDDAASYVISNSLKKYLAEKHLDRVMDDSIMWDSGLTRARGGYAGDDLTRCIDSKTRLWQVPNSQLVGDNILLSTLDPKCVNGVE